MVFVSTGAGGASRLGSCLIKFVQRLSEYSEALGTQYGTWVFDLDLGLQNSTNVLHQTMEIIIGDVDD